VFSYYFSIQARAVESESVFSHLETVWRFKPSRDRSDYTVVDFSLSYALQDPIQSRLMAAVFESISSRTMEAFETRCREKYKP
jgi:ribosome-associated toxin RatA of RatAB toxin-antitoxin module